MTESRATCKVVKSRDETLLLSQETRILFRARRDIARIPIGGGKGRVQIDRKMVKLRRGFSFRFVSLRYVTLHYVAFSLSIESECKAVVDEYIT